MQKGRKRNEAQQQVLTGAWLRAAHVRCMVLNLYQRQHKHQERAEVAEHVEALLAEQAGAAGHARPSAEGTGAHIGRQV